MIVQYKSLNSNYEYFIMNEILDNENISQRELSRKLGVSLGTANVLINKMITEGIIKMEHVSQKQVAYMLTPVGMMEKTKKTISYLKGHYRVIYETKEKVKVVLDELTLKYENVLILKVKDEMGEIIKLAVTEYKSKDKSKKIKMISENYNFESIDGQKIKDTVLLYAIENQELVDKKLKTNNITIVNLLERL
ncbi:winged helix-turn-helix transcriptional regulator [Sedimentibacter sp. zth1]|uniref:winged helix-turn-helix transcriptional regulator n=1 Tax=Sedimentibacter sp. zth1 TaxID=2816908 RepID=UPI001A90E4A0|nr:winged helix-turn-helix transcriptional regulator [Sedimentibacter sp. zth1]QSX05274.1 winged helix-turn-helix transcriptional regulator [Sedimentibacter sp. zth1]